MRRRVGINHHVCQQIKLIINILDIGVIASIKELIYTRARTRAR